MGGTPRPSTCVQTKATQSEWVASECTTAGLCAARTGAGWVRGKRQAGSRSVTAARLVSCWAALPTTKLQMLCEAILTKVESTAGCALHHPDLPRPIFWCMQRIGRVPHIRSTPVQQDCDEPWLWPGKQMATPAGGAPAALLAVGSPGQGRRLAGSNRRTCGNMLHHAGLASCLSDRRRCADSSGICISASRCSSADLLPCCSRGAAPCWRACCARASSPPASSASPAGPSASAA